MSKDVYPANLWRKFPERYQEKRYAKLVSWSSVYAAPSGFEDAAPYIVAIIEFDDKTRACAQLTDVKEQDLKYGLNLRPVLRMMFDSGEKGVIPYGTKYTV